MYGLARTIGWVVAGDTALILFLIVFGLLLNVMKIPAHGLFICSVLTDYSLASYCRLRSIRSSRLS
jgi:hypothetical protein